MIDTREVTTDIDDDREPCLIPRGEVEQIDDTTIPFPFDDGESDA